MSQKTPLAVAREKKGILLADLALVVGCNKAHLSRIERGTGVASPMLAKKLALYFGDEVTRDQILFPEEYPADGKKPARSEKGRA